MSIVLRSGTPTDAAACGTICYEAFRAIGTAHNFQPDFPSPDVASGVLSALLGHPGFYSVVAESEGRVVGSNFLDERSSIAGVGPITVDPYRQNRGVGGRRDFVWLPQNNGERTSLVTFSAISKFTQLGRVFRIYFSLP